jgi:hypothetical protein
MAEVQELVSLYVPLGFTSSAARHLPPYLSFNPYSSFHTSALLAAGIDSITLPFRASGKVMAGIVVPAAEAVQHYPVQHYPVQQYAVKQYAVQHYTHQQGTV